MDALMLEEFTPLVLIGVVVATIIFFISRKISRQALILISIIMSLVCVGIVFYSRVIGGWEGFGLLFVAISGFIGVWVGTIIGVIIRKK